MRRAKQSTAFNGTGNPIMKQSNYNSPSPVQLCDSSSQLHPTWSLFSDILLISCDESIQRRPSTLRSPSQYPRNVDPLPYFCTASIGLAQAPSGRTYNHACRRTNGQKSYPRISSHGFTLQLNASISIGQSLLYIPTCGHGIWTSFVRSWCFISMTSFALLKLFQITQQVMHLQTCSVGSFCV